MIMKKFLTNKRSDHAISPVIGTILMVAATVIIAGAVYAAVNAYNGKATKTGPDASFKAQAIDTDNDGLEDVIKVTYLSGPTGASNVKLTAKYTNGTDQTPSTMSWSPGDYQSIDPTWAGTLFVTVTVGENTVLDQTLAVKE